MTGFAALEREPLLAHVLGLQERLEGLRGVERAEDPQLLGALRLLLVALDPLLDPLALLGVLHVHVLDADGAAVGVAEHAQHVAQGHELLTGEPGDGELPVEVPQRQAVLGDVEIGVLALLVVQWVDVGHEVARAPGTRG